MNPRRGTRIGRAGVATGKQFLRVAGLVSLSAALASAPSACSSRPADEPSSGQGARAGSGGQGGGESDGGLDAASFEPLEVVALTVIHPGEPPEIVDEGSSLTLRFPPQGGFVLWTSARVRGLQTSYAEVRSRLRRLSTREIVADEGRTPDMGPVPGMAGWSQPEPLDLRNVNHLPICPNYEQTSIVGQPFELEISVTELDDAGSPTGRRGTVSKTVTPVCAPGSESCLCECSPGYKLGGCSVDGGTPDE